MRFGLALLFLTPAATVQAQKATNATAAKSTNATAQKEQEEIKELKKEIEELKQEEKSTVKKDAAPKIQQQGTGQNIGGTTEKVDLLDNPKTK